MCVSQSTFENRKNRKQKCKKVLMSVMMSASVFRVTSCCNFWDDDKQMCDTSVTFVIIHFGYAEIDKLYQDLCLHSL